MRFRTLAIRTSLGLTLPLFVGCSLAKQAAETAGEAFNRAFALDSGPYLGLAVEPSALGGVFAAPIAAAFENDKPSVQVPAWYDVVDRKVVVLVDHQGTEAPKSMASLGLQRLSSMLQESGARVNDHEAANQVVELLQQVQANQDSEAARTRLDQLGVDDVYLLEIAGYRVQRRPNAGQDRRPFQLECTVLVRCVDARSLELGLTGSVQVNTSVADEAAGSKRANEALESLVAELKRALQNSASARDLERAE